MFEFLLTVGGKIEFLGKQVRFIIFILLCNNTLVKCNFYFVFYGKRGPGREKCPGPLKVINAPWH